MVRRRDNCRRNGRFFIMTVVQYILGAVLIVCAIFLTLVVLFQNKSKGLSGAIGGGNSSSETYFEKNKGSSKEKKLSKLTTIVSIVFVVLVLVTFLFCTK